MSDLKIYCLPISGGCFVSQLGLLCEVFNAIKLNNNGEVKGCLNYQPNLVLCSSGGNVAAYVGLAGDWSEAGILRVARELKSEIFVKSWFPKDLSFIPSWFLTFVTGTLYRKGSGGVELFHQIFNSNTVQRVEIWTGTYDKNNRKAQFFCNLSRGNSMIDPDIFSGYRDRYDSMPLEFLNGNLTQLAHSTNASAAIPVLVSHQKINENDYADGGVIYPSPLYCFCPEICRIVTGRLEKPEGNFLVQTESNEILEFQENKNINMIEMNNDGIFEYSEKLPEKKLKLIYFSSYQTEEINRPSALASVGAVLEQIIHSTIIQDINASINLLHKICENPNKIKNAKFRDLNTHMLADIFRLIDTYKHSVLILSPKGCPTVSILNFNPDHLIETINNSRIDYLADLWYYEFD